MKFGVQIPTSVEEAIELDKNNNNTLWTEAIKKEKSRVFVAFQLLEDDEPLPFGSTKIPYHIAFDVKFDLTQKARLVAGGYQHKDVPAYHSYASVVSRDSV